MPEIKALQESRGLDSFTVLAVNAGETLPEAQRFIDFLQAPFVYALDPGLVVSDAYGVYGLPLSVFIDSDGFVRATYNGHANRQRLETYITAAVEARPPGALPDQLKLISTIPRDRILRLTRSSPGRLDFASRSLRCDASYCAQSAVDAVKALPGVTSVRYDSRAAEPKLTLRYNANALSEQQLIDTVLGRLSALPDPVYTSELELQR
jgi:hypothetical protein